MKIETAIHEWQTRGIEDFFYSFCCDQPFSRHSTYFLAMGAELIGKSYIIGWHYKKYQNQPFKTAKEIIDTIARKNSHNLFGIYQNISKLSKHNKILDMLDLEWDKRVGHDLLKALSSASMECRYPVLKPSHTQFKINDGIFHDVLNSSCTEELTYSLAREVLYLTKRDFGVMITPEAFDALRPKAQVIRFKRLFFSNKSRQYIANRRSN